jgi:N-acetylated-alpha-linked acidic dipeptidase
VEKNREIEEGVFTASDDPKHKTVPPPTEAVPPFLDLAPLQNGLAALQTASARYDKAFEHAKAADGSIPARLSLGALNADLIAVERSLTLSDGLPGRSWFQNQIYAPGLYTGYGVKTLPGVRESIEQKQWKLAQEQIVRVGGVLENAGERIQSAAAELDRGSQ